MWTVKEVSELTGVSIRTLHHYDAIGLLKPARVSQAGYRLYDDAALERLQAILLLRELQFPLKEIGTILDSPDYDAGEALREQIRLLEMQRARLDQLIAHARDILDKGAGTMDFAVFDTREMDEYKAEARERWGKTEAWNEYAQREENGLDPKTAGGKLMEKIAEFGALQTLSPDDAAVQEKVCELQDFITENFYTCTKEIFRGLGEMYAADERFRRNIDKAGGDGTAAFVSRAIEVYCIEK